MRLSAKQRENTGKVLVSLITVDVATLIAGNVFSPKGFVLPIFTLGCILLLMFYFVLLWIER